MVLPFLFKRVPAFVVALLVGITANSIFQITPGPASGNTSVPGSADGLGSGSGPFTPPHGYAPGPVRDGTNRRFILSKPRAEYTAEARHNSTQGEVILKVQFLASGQIGSISTIQGLEDGLTGSAYAAARRIVFEPATQDGRPITVTERVIYTFAIY
jgi:TonB family protein